MTRPDVPTRVPAQFGDMGNYCFQKMVVPEIHLRMMFAGRLDAERLARAMALVTEAELVIGCRFVPRFLMPYWQRLSDADLSPAALLQQADAPDAAAAEAIEERFMAEERTITRGPQILGLLVRTPAGDRLTIKAGHLAVDAGGTKEMVVMVAEFYRALVDQSDFRPPVNRGSRSLRQAYRGLRFADWLAIARRHFVDLRSNMIPFHSVSYPSARSSGGPVFFETRRLNAERVNQVREAAIPMRATLNDMSNVGMVRALARRCGVKPGEALRMWGTVDLRRFLPSRRPEALCNFSSFYFVNLGSGPRESFDATLAEVKRQIDEQKAGPIGRPFLAAAYVTGLGWPFGPRYAVMSRLFMRAWETGNAPPALTNMGEIPASLDFGDAPLTEAELIVPRVKPPAFCLGLSGFRGTLTLSAGFDAAGVPREEIAAFLKMIDEEMTP